MACKVLLRTNTPCIETLKMNGLLSLKMGTARQIFHTDWLRYSIHHHWWPTALRAWQKMVLQHSDHLTHRRNIDWIFCNDIQHVKWSSAVLFLKKKRRIMTGTVISKFWTLRRVTVLNWKDESGGTQRKQDFEVKSWGRVLLYRQHALSISLLLNHKSVCTAWSVPQGQQNEEASSFQKHTPLKPNTNTH